MLFNQGLDKLENGREKSMDKRSIYSVIQEDQALINIIEVRQIKKWSHISKIMENQFLIYGRSGKQCRQRWHNQLDPSIRNCQWTLQEQKVLFENHNIFGNKWARISQELNGRTDNCVKNHFYSTLRRAFRRLNQYISSNKQRLGIKQMKTVIMSKLVAAAEDKFINKLKLPDQIVNKSIQLKNRLLPFSKQIDNTNQDEALMETLIKEILQFTKSYKRKKSRKPKIVKQGDDDDLFNQESISIKQDSSHQDLEISMDCLEYVKVEPKQIQPHQNLFSYAQCQLIVQKQTFCQTKQIENGFDMIHKQDSKIIEEGSLQMLKKASNYSNWSNIMRLPSLKQRISQGSFNPIIESGLILQRSLHMGNLFGCDFEQLY